MGDGFDRESWERRWSAALSNGTHAVEGRPPNPHLLAEAAELPPGSALDAGAGHGAEAMWLAQRGWRVTAVDFSATALQHARAAAQRRGPEVAARIDWIEADMMTWPPPPGRYDLVICLFMHVAGSVEDLVSRLAAAVAPGGTLLLAGHPAIDPATGEPTRASGQTQVSVEQALAVLDPARWTIHIAEQRRRPAAGGGVDAVVLATARDD